MPNSTETTCNNCIYFQTIDIGANEWELDEKDICQLNWPPLSEETLKAIISGTLDFSPVTTASKCKEYEC